MSNKPQTTAFRREGHPSRRPGRGVTDQATPQQEQPAGGRGPDMTRPGQMGRKPRRRRGTLPGTAPGEAVGPAIQLTVRGNGNRITVTVHAPDDLTAATPGVGEATDGSWSWTWRRAWAVIIGLAAIVTAIAAVLALL